MKGLGTDIIEVARIQAAISRHGQKFLDRWFTPKEQEYCNRHVESQRNYAGRFAAKEAIAKALGTGFGEDLSWQDIEILNDGMGRPLVTLSDEADKRFASPIIQCSISHCKEYATATAIVL